MPDPVAGVPTDVAGFVGTSAPPDGATAVTGAGELNLEPGALDTAARAYFLNGGRKLYLSTSLAALAGIDEITIVAAPEAAGLPPGEFEAADAALVAHAEGCRRRIAVLDAPLQASSSDLLALRRRFESSRAALYHPWITMVGSPGPVPPSGAVAGVMARTAVHLPPTGEVRGATGPALEIGPAEQEALSGQGVNLLRSPPGGGARVWGARTTSTDGEWKYVNVRRLFVFLEHSLDLGLQWVVFEPNGENLWSGVRAVVGDFLQARWRAGALQGRRPEEAFFVHCDRTTMTQGDLDEGRLVCTIGVALTRPAEFVTFRIGRWTADHPAGDDD